ncbi:MAG: ABC transporter ATP-binding protein [Coriobacteriia bacterium]
MTSIADMPGTGVAASAPAIRATGLSRTFGDIVAVGGVDLAVRRGAVFGLLGPDGAGKSTLIRMLATVLPPDDGDALILGESVTRSARRVTPHIGYMSQRFSMYPDLTVAENLAFFATIRGVPKALQRERGQALLESMGLDEFARRQARYLSGGMKQKLMLATTLMHEPDLLLLDEPTTGVDPVSRREFWRILAGLHHAGRTVLVATPYMDEAERCTDIAFMDGGRIRHRGTPAEITALVPGTLFEVIAPAPRAALTALAGTPGVTSAHLYGEAVRVLWAGTGESGDADAGAAGRADAGAGAAGRAAVETGAQELLGRLRAAGVAVDSVRAVRIDMEAAFTFLAEQEAAS